jgi:hypothetical protein
MKSDTLLHVISTCRKHLPVHLWLITDFVTRLTGRVPLMEQELLILQEHLSSSPVFSGVRVTRFLALCVCFVDRCLYLCTFSFGHCVVCSSLIYGFLLPLWYLQTLLQLIISNGSFVSCRGKWGVIWSLSLEEDPAKEKLSFLVGSGYHFTVCFYRFAFSSSTYFHILVFPTWSFYF